MRDKSEDNNFSVNPIILFKDLKDAASMFFTALCGKYPLPRKSFIWLVLFLLYFVIPLDLVPETVFLLLGFTDDMLLLVYILNKMRPDIDNYREFVKKGKLKNEKTF
ncbi:MAG: DUF1232 domain-containing protein [Elusimicrobiota bacterium]|jgi:uncharacterized membrane protein YkvA (DUF1232 family)|nr:DUF1232 domain-containing protein [Elusimicrobiota bacterium]